MTDTCVDDFKKYKMKLATTNMSIDNAMINCYMAIFIYRYIHMYVLYNIVYARMVFNSP